MYYKSTTLIRINLRKTLITFSYNISYFMSTSSIYLVRRLGFFWVKLDTLNGPSWVFNLYSLWEEDLIFSIFIRAYKGFSILISLVFLLFIGLSIDLLSSRVLRFRTTGGEKQRFLILVPEYNRELLSLKKLLFYYDTFWSIDPSNFLMK